MCSIVGSFDKDKIIELCELNSYRGQYSHSISYYDYSNQSMILVKRKLGPINYDDILIPQDSYCIVHQQAPTSASKNVNIHPAKNGRDLLWHNGIIKENEIVRLKGKLKNESDWDTELILDQLCHTSNVMDIDGSFSCLASLGYNLYIFRNEIAPMFINDDNMDISSTMFKGSKALKPNIIFRLNFKTLDFEPTSVEFNTVDNPYFFG